MMYITKRIDKHIDKYKSHGILTYDEKDYTKDYNNIFAPVKNLLGLFKTYVYTKTILTQRPRLNTRM